MKKFILTFVLSAFFLSAPSFASGSSVTVHVSGLVCDFCARAVEKMFGQKDEVSVVKVDLDKKTVAIDFKDNQSIDDKTITTLITDSGYNVISIEHPEGKK